MEAGDRREKLLKILHERSKAVSGSRLAEELGVSRQVIVQDIALLRAGGENIFATPQGYLLTLSGKDVVKRVFACIHGADGIGEELLTIVNSGGKVLDVIVEHPLYGDLRGLLMLATPADVQDYLKNYRASQAKPLSVLTEGVHLHTIEAENVSLLGTIEKALKEKGFLFQQT